MSTTRYSSIANRNEVTRRLSKGNGKIAGLKMCVAVDDAALVPVEVVGIEFNFGGNQQSGVMVKVRPVGGWGELIVNPASLLDNNKESHDLFHRKTQANELCRLVQNSNSDRQRRSIVLATRDKMTPAQKKVFDALAPDIFGGQKDMVASINKESSKYTLDRLIQKAANIMHGIEGEATYDD